VITVDRICGRSEAERKSGLARRQRRLAEWPCRLRGLSSAPTVVFSSRFAPADQTRPRLVLYFKRGASLQLCNCRISRGGYRRGDAHPEAGEVRRRASSAVYSIADHPLTRPDARRRAALLPNTADQLVKAFSYFAVWSEPFKNAVAGGRDRARRPIGPIGRTTRCSIAEHSAIVIKSRRGVFRAGAAG
jgi:hypothetical protein